MFSQTHINYELDINLSSNNQTISYESSFSSNSIMDIRNFNNEILFLGTNSVLSFIDLISSNNYQYGHLNFINLPKGGNPALCIRNNMIALSGVIDTLVLGGYEAKGTGLSYSRDGGDTWFFLPQPIDSLPSENMDGYQTISWGGQDLLSLSVTTEINNVSYDIAIDEKFIYTANWAGGIRRYNYLPTSDNLGKWEIIPLPRDEDIDLRCGEINSDTYSINPKDPSDGGNHNHKGFSVYVVQDTLWAGTASGINKGIILDNGCIDWVQHYKSGLDNISGNWVIGFVNQPLNGFNRLWAITWATEYPEINALSYTENGGSTWKVSNPFGNNGGKVYDLHIYGNSIWASTENGLYFSNNGQYWEKYSQFIDVITGEKILSESVYSSYFLEEFETLFIGTGDGMAIIDPESTEVIRFWEPANLFSVYPNPFLINDYNQINSDGHVRFIYNNPNHKKGKIDIFDFSMDRVVQLTDYHFIGSESEIIWNGKNQYGAKVANGVYFCRLSLASKYYWTKLAVIN